MIAAAARLGQSALTLIDKALFMKRPAALLVMCLALPAAAPATAQEIIDFAPFYYVTGQPNRLYLDGRLEPGFEPLLSFMAALEAYPAIDTLIMHSLGGSGKSAAAIGSMVRAREIDTIVPAIASCFSACARIFFAGIGRYAFGDLGVHQPLFDPWFLDAEELEGVMFDQFVCYGAAPEVQAAAAATPPEEMYIFSDNELVDLGINRSHAAGLAAMIPPEPNAPLPAQIGFPRVSGDASWAYLELSVGNGLAAGVEGTVAWSAYPNPAAPTLQAEVRFPTEGIHLSIVLMPLDRSRFPDFAWGAIITELSDNGTARTTAETLFLVHDPTIDSSFPPAVPLPGNGVETRGIPTVFSEISLEAMAETDGLYLYNPGTDNAQVNQFIITIPKGKAGNAALAAWLPAMEAYVAANTNSNCTPHATTAEDLFRLSLGDVGAD